MNEQKEIIIKGAREHNLKNIDINLPRNNLIVITGVSGSGKSSLAFDTIYAEGQRRYVESLSSYARQFLGQMQKPEVDYIEGLSPAISIEQKAASRNPRSTVGTVTEIYDYLRLLFTHISKPYCYNCGREISSQTEDEIINKILLIPVNTKILILAPKVQNRKGEYKKFFEEILKKGYSRVRVDNEIYDLQESLDIKIDKNKKHNIDIVIDRLIIREGINERLTDSVELGLKEGEGLLKVVEIDNEKEHFFSEINSCPSCGISYGEISPQLFSFNSPLGMCKTCNGLGVITEVDEDLVIDNPEISILNGACSLFGDLNKKNDSWTLAQLNSLAEHYNFKLDTPFKDLSDNIKKILLYGSGDDTINFKYKSDVHEITSNRQFEGIIPMIRRRYKQTQSEAARNYYTKFMTEIECPECLGAKLSKEALSYKIADKNIIDLCRLTIKDCVEFFNELEKKLTETEWQISKEIIKEIKTRLGFLINVGLHYLTLDRKAPTLSGGESQRIRLASQIGSGLVGVLYVLDEPSIGLHQRDNEKLIAALKKLRDIGNTVIVVEHDEDTIRNADYIVDMGLGAGVNGGEIVAKGKLDEIISSDKSLTASYLRGHLFIPPNKNVRKGNGKYLEIKGCRLNNLKNVNLKIPLGKFICVTGVSGSGKSSLINETLYKALSRIINKSNVIPGHYDKILGLENIDKVLEINQSPIGRTPRSNPATYTGVFTPIREIFAKTKQAKIRGFTPSRFSFNVKGGRCEACFGDGYIKKEMHFLPDVYVPCEVCNGTRFNKATLEIKYKDKNIHDVLQMDVTEAINFFENIPEIKRILQTLYDVGLDYIKLGQPATTLSGGEAQRIKLSSELAKRSTGNTIYILDEPTTGLHFADVKKLLEVLNRLVDQGNTVIVIEHNLDVIKSADYIFDLGPEGGDGGGEIIAEGTPYELIKYENSFTAQFLKKVLEK